MCIMSDPMTVSRRLVAVFAADVEGYSRLMGADEVGTLKGLTEWLAILDKLADGVAPKFIASANRRAAPLGEGVACIALRRSTT